VVSRLLGRYENFPDVIHGVARFTCESSKSKAQHAILSALHKLNEQVFSLKDIATISYSQCEVSFEFGVADGVEFGYLDAEELDKMQKSIAREVLQAMDFLWVIRYHIIKNGKRVPLKFDYHMLRFIFYNRNNLELRVSHQRGIRRISVENLITFITKRINEELSQNRLRQLVVENLRAL
jgi:hypothetical protein